MSMSDTPRASSSTIETKLARLRSAQEKAALLIYQGQEWLLPHFERLNKEVELYESKQALLDKALTIAKEAMEKKKR